MSNFLWTARRMRVAPVALLLAACSGGGTSMTPAASQQSTVETKRIHSWMSPEAKSTDLLYVSEYNSNDVYVYSYPKGKLVGTLTDAEYPWGLCSDKKGNVFIPGQNQSEIFEYAHGGTTPIATLNDPYGYPLGCSVDPSSGNLAVTNYPNNYYSGNVAVYPNGSGTPQSYETAPTINASYFCGYDDKGNLFVDGYSPYSKFAFGELPNGSSTFTPISLPSSMDGPGGVQWDGKHVAVGSLYGSSGSTGVIYQFKFKGTQPKEVGSTTLVGGTLTGLFTMYQFWIEKNKVVGDPWSDVDVWKYPTGGSATKTFNNNFFGVGATISRK